MLKNMVASNIQKRFIPLQSHANRHWMQCCMQRRFIHQMNDRKKSWTCFVEQPKDSIYCTRKCTYSARVNHPMRTMTIDTTPTRKAYKQQQHQQGNVSVDSSETETGNSEDMNLPTWQFTVYNISRSINLDSNTNTALNNLLKQFGCWKMEDGKLSLILQLSTPASINENQAIGEAPTLGMVDIGEATGRSYIVLYHFGSICFLNCDEELQEQWISKLRDSDPNFVVTKDYLRVVVDRESKDWCRMGRDHMIVQKLDLNNLNIISGVLSRSIALKSYEISAQHTLENFRLLNAQIEKTGKINRYDEKRLVPVFANANGLKCDLLLSVRLLERPDVTWAFQHYDQIYEMLQSEFEIQNRFEHLEKKLDFIQQNNMFYMELQHSRKSETSEWLIIILIATEICIALIHHYRESTEKKLKEQLKKERLAAINS